MRSSQVGDTERPTSFTAYDRHCHSLKLFVIFSLRLSLFASNSANLLAIELTAEGFQIIYGTNTSHSFTVTAELLNH